jgi:hypothetical protein
MTAQIKIIFSFYLAFKRIEMAFQTSGGKPFAAANGAARGMAVVVTRLLYIGP